MDMGEERDAGALAARQRHASDGDPGGAHLHIRLERQSVRPCACADLAGPRRQPPRPSGSRTRPEQRGLPSDLRSILLWRPGPRRGEAPYVDDEYRIS